MRGKAPLIGFWVFLRGVVMSSRGQKKPKLSDLSRKALTREEKEVAENAFLTGQPMVTALLGQAMVEYDLDRLLKTRFKKKDDDTWGELTGERGPLGSFSSKIIVGHAFDLFDDATRDHLDRIRRIRNQFAHARLRFRGPLSPVGTSILETAGEAAQQELQAHQMGDRCEGKRGRFLQAALPDSLRLPHSAIYPRPSDSEQEHR
jgi:hypothetical protein